MPRIPSSPDAPIVKPEVVFIENLLEEMAEGRMRIPRFQRPFVWRPSDMLDLFDSIYKGYPIGSLLLWETSDSVESTNEIGPVKIEPAKGKPLTYILDGHQRLATLFGGLRLPKKSPTGPNQQEWRWWIWFDLAKEIFTHWPKGQPGSSLFPMRGILRTVDFLEEARRLQTDNPAFADKQIRKAEFLSQKVKNYKVAVTRIQGGSLGQAVEIFSRLNTKGRSMTLDQMVSALTYREGKRGMNLSGRIDGILEELGEFGFGHVNRRTIFRSIVAAAGKEIQNTNWEVIAKELGSELSAPIDATNGSLKLSASFLSSVIQVPVDELLPYTNQILMLSEFFHHRPSPTEKQTAILAKWFWSTSFSGWFAGANTTQINHAIQEMQQFAANERHTFTVMSLDDPARPFPITFDMRGARLRALLLVTIRLGPRDPVSGELIDARKLIGERGNNAFLHVFSDAPGELVSNPANRILFAKVSGQSAKARLLALKKTEKKKMILESHGIPPEAFSALEKDDARSFIELRAKRLAEIETAFMQTIGVVPAKKPTGETDLDADEDVDSDG